MKIAATVNCERFLICICVLGIFILTLGSPCVDLRISDVAAGAQFAGRLCRSSMLMLTFNSLSPKKELWLI